MSVMQAVVRQLLGDYETRAANCSKAAAEEHHRETTIFLNARSSLLNEIVDDLRRLSRVAALGDLS